jgi:dTDP-4-amino-4,6-dideoxygalactose transaminase
MLDLVDIPQCDLAAEHRALQPELEAAVRRVLASNRFVLGPEVAAFERELAAALGVEHAVGLSSGTDALTCLLLASGVGPDDEVVTSPFSFFATVEAIVRAGARPVFADVDPRTLNIDPDEAAARVGPRTRAVLVVHLFGRAANLAALEGTCADAGIALLGDAAQAIDAKAPDGRRVAGIGGGAALSFFPSKNLGGFGDGGAIVTRDPALAEKVRALRVHGAREKGVHESIGGNFRLDEIQAALLRVKLPHLGAWTERRRSIAALYRDALAGLSIDLPPEDAGCVWNQFVIRVLGPAGRRDALAAHLRSAGIETAVYYRLPLHRQPALAYLGVRAGRLPHAERAAAEALAIPLFPGLSESDALRVVDAIREFCRSPTGEIKK